MDPAFNVVFTKELGVGVGVDVDAEEPPVPHVIVTLSEMGPAVFTFTETLNEQLDPALSVAQLLVSPRVYALGFPTIETVHPDAAEFPVLVIVTFVEAFPPTAICEFPNAPPFGEKLKLTADGVAVGTGVGVGVETVDEPPQAPPMFR